MRMLYLVPFLLAIPAGCSNDYSFNEVKDELLEEDTGGPRAFVYDPEEPWCDFSACRSVGEAESPLWVPGETYYHDPGIDLAGNGDHHYFEGAHNFWFLHRPGTVLEGFRLFGSSTPESAFPEDQTFRMLLTTGADSPASSNGQLGVQVWIDAFRQSDDLTPELSATYGWLAEGSEAMGNLDTMPPSAVFESWMVHVESDGDPPVCDYHLNVCVDLDWSYGDAARRVPANSTCEPGSGRFRLIPWVWADTDHDDAYAIMLKPLQVSGSGAMTKAAWVTSITPVTTNGQSLRVVKSDRRFEWDSSDSLKKASIVSMPVPSTGAQFQAGVIGGTPPFLIDQMPGTTMMDMEVDLSWSCATPTAMEEVFLDQGYSFTASDIGCGVSWPQKFTLRTIPTVSPTTIAIEAYGDLNTSAQTDLTTTATGRSFSFSQGSLKFAGELQNATANGVDLVVSQLAFDGTTLCTPGTYSLLPE